MCLVWGHESPFPHLGHAPAACFVLNTRRPVRSLFSVYCDNILSSPFGVEIIANVVVSGAIIGHIARSIVKGGMVAASSTRMNVPPLPRSAWWGFRPAQQTQTATPSLHSQ